LAVSLRTWMQNPIYEWASAPISCAGTPDLLGRIYYRRPSLLSNCPFRNWGFLARSMVFTRRLHFFSLSQLFVFFVVPPRCRTAILCNSPPPRHFSMQFRLRALLAEPISPFFFCCPLISRYPKSIRLFLTATALDWPGQAPAPPTLVPRSRVRVLSRCLPRELGPKAHGR